MQIQIDSKILINRSDAINVYAKELLEAEFKINKNKWGDLSIVKFDKINCQLIYTDWIHDKRGAKGRGEVSMKQKVKKKFLADNIIVSNNYIHVCGVEEMHIKLQSIKMINFQEKQVSIITGKHRYQIVTNSFKLNVHLITIIEWIASTSINNTHIGKKIRFQIN